MSTVARPKFSIAIPVYNGENYLRRALASVAAQSVQDYELIIVNNASTDSTAAICREFAEKDPRVRYYTNERNIGVNPNWDRCAELARGEYFCWLAHDDELTPEFIRRCAEVLNQDDNVVLVHSLVQIIDPDNKLISIYDSGLSDSDSDQVHKRFQAMTHIRHTCTAIFGLFRLETLRKTQVMTPNHHGVDRSLLAEISLIGKIVQIDEPLFRNREHKDRYVRRIRPSQRSAFHQRGKGRVEVSQLMLMHDYKQAVENHVSDPLEKARCRRVLRMWWFKEWNLARLTIELVAKSMPRLYDWAKWLSDRLIKPKHPTVASVKRPK